jgi:hypothetical protein
LIVWRLHFIIELARRISDLAIKNHKNCLALNPKNVGGAKKLEELRKRS